MKFDLLKEQISKIFLNLEINKYFPIRWYLLILITLLSCQNPFAPALRTCSECSNVLSDQTTIDGIFQNFRYAYTLKDTVSYSNLLSPDFIFISKNYDRQADISWDRQEDMIITWRLFQAADVIDLIWYKDLNSDGDSLRMTIRRGFQLSIYFNANYHESFHGTAEFTIIRSNTRDSWKISQWRDNSYND
ncbi:MAG: hypothetical protein NT007_04865 [Candidatus Kapabacteria bacterium]|nr:hypothetical protein [Candidatus Kapabacteria bacterium]